MRLWDRASSHLHGTPRGGLGGPGKGPEQAGSPLNTDSKPAPEKDLWAPEAGAHQQPGPHHLAGGAPVRPSQRPPAQCLLTQQTSPSLGPGGSLTAPSPPGLFGTPVQGASPLPRCRPPPTLRPASHVLPSAPCPGLPGPRRRSTLTAAPEPLRAAGPSHPSSCGSRGPAVVHPRTWQWPEPPFCLPPPQSTRSFLPEGEVTSAGP